MALIAPGPLAPTPKRDDVPAPAPIDLALRPLDQAVAPAAPVSGTSDRWPDDHPSSSASGPVREPSLPGLIRSDPDVAPPPPPPPPSARSVAKSVRRALVRRVRLATSSGPAGAAGEAIDLLVMDPSDADRRQLCGLLEGFGFAVHATRNMAQTVALLDARAFAAVFLDLVLDGVASSQASLLCERVRLAPSQIANRAPALIILAEQARPVDRVRATLAGAEAFLTKPLSRGHVVRALEDCGVPLPQDARRI